MPVRSPRSPPVSRYHLTSTTVLLYGVDRSRKGSGVRMGNRPLNLRGGGVKHRRALTEYSISPRLFPMRASPPSCMPRAALKMRSDCEKQLLYTSCPWVQSHLVEVLMLQQMPSIDRFLIFEISESHFLNSVLRMSEPVLYA